MSDAVLGDSLEQVDQLLADLGDGGPDPRDGLVGYVLGVRSAEHNVGCPQDELFVLAWDAEHVVDDAQRQQRGERRDEVALTRAGDLLQHLGGGLFGQPTQLGEYPGGEAPRHDLAQPHVFGIVHVDDGAAVFAHLGGLVENLRSLPGTELSRPAADVDDVAVGPHRPEPAGLRRVGSVGADEHRAAGLAKAPVELAAVSWTLLPPLQIDQRRELLLVGVDCTHSTRFWHYCHFQAMPGYRRIRFNASESDP